MALYAFDGTWNENEPDLGSITNVVKFRDAYGYNGARAEYIEGVGTRFGAIGRVLGGVFGAGGKTRVEEMYDLLLANWQAGDETVDIIGFSRGAALAAHFANVVATVGIRTDDGDELARPRVRFLGLWDIVGSFGVPINAVLKFQELNVGWDLEATPNTEHTYHAMALDERRQTFRVTRLDADASRDHVTELWFRGVHSDVGGGNENVRLSNVSLVWMMNRALEHGLDLDPAVLAAAEGQRNPLAPLSENLDLIRNKRRRTFSTDAVHSSAVGRVLEPGEAATFTVTAAEQFSWSGVRVEAGGHYLFTPDADGEWCDASIRCGADGWKTEDLPWVKEVVVKHWEDNRRHKTANWFEVIGSIGNDEDHEDFFRIGLGGPDAIHTAIEDGELYAFANDLATTYGNNHGELRVSIERVADPAGLSR